jgi:hypothetical protein
MAIELIAPAPPRAGSECTMELADNNAAFIASGVDMSA